MKTFTILFNANFLKSLLSLSILLCANIVFGQVEICDNRIDDDGDGLIDCLDPDCDDYLSCFTCDPSYYQVHSNNALVLLDPFTGNYTQIGTISGVDQINGQSYNVLDGHVYAPAKIGSTQTLVMLNKDGSTIDLGLDLGSSGIYYVGGADDQGNLYLGRGSAPIIKIDLTAPTLSVEELSISSPGVADFAFNVRSRKLYGLTGGDQLKEIDPFTQVINTYDLSGAINNENGAYGAVWSNDSDFIYAYNNSSGKIYKINLQDYTTTVVVNGTGNLPTNDGFNCINAPSPFESNCGDGIDDDGDGLADCDDPDCATDNICLVEICDNGIDDDLDGLTDCEDTECHSLAICIEICDNGVDDNGDGFIDGDDPQCNSNSANNGGLESNRRLSNAIANRNLNRQKVGSPAIDKVFDNSNLSLFRRGGGINLKSLIPVDVIESTTTLISTPSDLTEITNAEEIFSVDIRKENQSLASILLIETKDEIYEHTKFICDRLDGAIIRDISTGMFYGQTFITMEIVHPGGQIEYACTFAAYYRDEKFYIENHWNLDQYPSDGNIFNFQIWASNYEALNTLVEAAIQKIADHGPIQSVYISKAPTVFVSNGKIFRNKLKLNIVNKIGARSINIAGSYTSTETSESVPFNVNKSLTGRYSESIEIEVDELYDIGFRIVNEKDQTMDDLFFADGAWGVDYNQDIADILDFNISESTNEIENNVYPVSRDIKMEANTNEDFTLFRALSPKFRPIKLSNYNHFNFIGSGNANVEVVLIKSSIEKWEEQFRTSIVLTEDLQSYKLNIDQFKSTDPSAKLNLNDITTILFKVKATKDSNVEVELKSLSFQNITNENQPNIDFDQAISISPNPLRTNAKVYFQSNVNASYRMVLTDIAGKETLTFNGKATVGINEFNLSKGSNMTNGMYLVNIYLDGERPLVQKLMVE